MVGMTQTVWDALAQQVGRADGPLSAALHETLACHADPGIRAAWLQRDDCPRALLDARAGRERDEELLHAIAVHPNLGSRGRRLLAGHALNSVAVTTALRADVSDDEGVAILDTRRRSAVRAALDRRNHRGWRSPQLAPVLGDDRWWDGLVARPRTAAKVAEIIPFTGYAALLDVAGHPEVWQVFDRRLSGMDFDDTETLASMLALLLGHDRALTPALRRAGRSHGGLVGAYVALLAGFEGGVTGTDLRDLYVGTALDSDTGTTILRNLRRDRYFTLLEAAQSKRLTETSYPPADALEFSETEWMQLLRANFDQIAVLIAATERGFLPWSRTGVEQLAAFVAEHLSTIQTPNRDFNQAFVALCADHLDVVIAHFRPHVRLMRAVAAHPACTLGLAMKLPVGAAFASYHGPVALAEHILEASGGALDVLSTLSTQFQGSVAELVGVAVGIDRDAL